MRLWNPILSQSNLVESPKSVKVELHFLQNRCSIDGLAKTILDKGCNGFIQKPFSLSDLSQKLRELLDKE